MSLEDVTRRRVLEHLQPLYDDAVKADAASGHDQRENWRALHLAAAIELLRTDETDIPTTRKR